MKKLSAPPRAPDLTKRMTSTHSFMSLGVGRASGSMRKVSSIRISGNALANCGARSKKEVAYRFRCG